jgi:ABC-2 type transport system permease protein
MISGSKFFLEGGACEATGIFQLPGDGIGLFASALTANQVVAALISLSAFLLLWIIDDFGYVLPTPFDTVVVNLSLSTHFRSFAVGSIYLSDVGFYLSVALLMLLLSVRALARR